MEADLQHYYGVDLRDLWRKGSTLTLRRLRVLLDGLPPDSLWWTTLRQEAPDDVVPAGDIDGMRWSTLHDLLAALIDATNGVQWTLAQVNSKGKVPHPKPFPRPGTQRKRRRGISAANMDRINGWINSPNRRKVASHGR